MTQEQTEDTLENNNMDNLQSSQTQENATSSIDEAMDAMNEALEGDTESVESQLEAAHAEIAELKDTLLRSVAEQENFKKRMERERLARIKYEGERIFKEILPAIDNLERAIDQGNGDSTDATQNLAALMEGIGMTKKILLANLAKFEVKPIESIGEPFDPQHQEALTMEPSETIPANHVVHEFEKGYFFKDRLLRPAKVIVSSGKGEKEGVK